MSDIVLISGSPAPHSRSDKVLDFIGSTLQHSGYTVTKISVTEIPAEALMYGHYNHGKIKNAADKIANAKSIVIASPVYKAAYTGALKAFIDLLPQDAFKHKTVLPIMTGGSFAHLLAIEYTLKPLIAIVKGQSLNGVFITDEQIDKTEKNPIIDQSIYNRIEKQLEYLIEPIEKGSISIVQ